MGCFGTAYRAAEEGRGWAGHGRGHERAEAGVLVVVPERFPRRSNRGYVPNFFFFPPLLLHPLFLSFYAKTRKAGEVWACVHFDLLAYFFYTYIYIFVPVFTNGALGVGWRESVDGLIDAAAMPGRVTAYMPVMDVRAAEPVGSVVFPYFRLSINGDRVPRSQTTGNSACVRLFRAKLVADGYGFG